MSALGHKPIVHVACLHGAMKIGGVTSTNVARCDAPQSQERGEQKGDATLGSSASMPLLCLLKGGRLIALLMHPHSKDDPGPHIGKRSYGHRMTFALSTFARVLVSGPWFTLRARLRKLVQGIAQWFDAAQAAMRFRVRPALKQDGRGTTQRLQTAGIDVPVAIIADFCQQSRGQMLACTRQALKDLMILMGQKN